MFEGAEISLYYDPMIAKLCAYGADRDQAIDRLRGALDGFYIAGVRDNIAFLAAIAGSERFRARAGCRPTSSPRNFPAASRPPTEPVPADRVIAGRRGAGREPDCDEGEVAEPPKLAEEPRRLTVLLDGRACAVSVCREAAAYASRARTAAHSPRPTGGRASR